MKSAFRLMIPMAVLALAACGTPPNKDPGTQPPGDEQAPEFQGGGQEGGQVGEAKYPGPYGVGIGSVIPNYQFYGFPRANVDHSQMVLLEMADFYNPTGTDVYPEGSPYGAGTPKPLAIVLDRSAVWCPPCNQEAATEIPAKRAQYAPKGEFFLTLTEGPEHNVDATQEDLTGWATRYHLNYPGSIDPNSTLAAVVGQDAYPGNVIVRTKDMKIVTWTAGVPQQDFWDLFQKVLDGQPVLPGDQ